MTLNRIFQTFARSVSIDHLSIDAIPNYSFNMTTACPIGSHVPKLKPILTVMLKIAKYVVLHKNHPC